MEKLNNQKELTGYQRLAVVLTKDLKRRRVNKLTMQAKARNCKTSK